MSGSPRQIDCCLGVSKKGRKGRKRDYAVIGTITVVVVISLIRENVICFIYLEEKRLVSAEDALPIVGAR